jgi:hypothetical protein
MTPLKKKKKEKKGENSNGCSGFRNFKFEAHSQCSALSAFHGWSLANHHSSPMAGALARTYTLPPSSDFESDVLCSLPVLPEYGAQPQPGALYVLVQRKPQIA